MLKIRGKMDIRTKASKLSVFIILCLFQFSANADSTTFELVKDINPGSSSGLFDEGLAFDNYYYGATVATANNKFFFLADDGVNGKELWTTDGTEANTRLVKNIETLRPDIQVSFMASCGNFILFGANGGPLDDSRGSVWVSDGTSSGTRQLYVMPSQIGVENDEYRSITDLRCANGVGYFTISDPAFKYEGSRSPIPSEVWVTKGTVQSTSKVASFDTLIAQGSYGLTDNSLIFNNNYYIFVIQNESSNNPKWDLWKINENGAVKTSATLFGSTPYFTHQTINSGNECFFITSTDYNGAASYLWRYIDTTDSLTRLRSNAPGAQFKNQFFFIKDDDNSGLWALDCISTTPNLIRYHSRNSYFSFFLKSNGDRLYYSESTDYSGGSIWSTDGTPEGTIEEFDVPYNPFAPSNERATYQLSEVYDNNLLLVVKAKNRSYYAVHQRNRAKDEFVRISPALLNSDNRNLETHKFKDITFMTANDNTYGKELWKMNIKSTPYLIMPSIYYLLFNE